MELGADLREGESLIENICNEAMHDILESKEFDDLLDDAFKSKAGLYASAITNEAEPSVEDLIQEQEAQQEEEKVESVFLNKPVPQYEEELKEVSGVDDQELFRKRMFM